MEDYKNRLPMHLRSFLGTADGRLADGTLTVYCATEQQKHMLEGAAERIIAEVTSKAAGRPVAVRLAVGEPEGEKHDKMRDLLRLGSNFDGFTIT